jgi:hypothetical protein
MSARSSLARVATALTLAAAAALTSSCGPGDGGPPVAARRETAPQWQDVFDGTPELYGVVRPQAIKRDAVYGTLWKTVLRVAQARSEMRGATTLEALEGCEELIVGVRKDPQSERRDDAALVLRGVPASLDAQKMADAAGHPVFRLLDPRAKVPEYEWIDRRSTDGGSVFVLPDRTWVGTIGDARARARQAFAAPFGRPTPKVDPQALAAVRVDAAFFAGPRFAKSQALGPLTRKLRAVTVALMPAKGGVVASLQYETEDASAFAEMHARRVIEELARQEPTAKRSFAWLKDAQVGHDGNTVVVKLPVPARLLEELPNATGGDLPL